MHEFRNGYVDRVPSPRSETPFWILIADLVAGRASWARS